MKKTPSLELGRYWIPATAGSVIASLGLWWFLLKDVSLWFLRMLAYVPLALLIAPGGLPPIAANPETGELTFNVLLNHDGRNPETGEPLHVDSIEFAADPRISEYFTGGWFTFLGLSIPLGFSLSQWTRNVRGLAVQVGLSVLALALYAYTSALTVVVNGSGGGSALLMETLRVCKYLLTLVFPYAVPFAVALLVHPQ